MAPVGFLCWNWFFQPTLSILGCWIQKTLVPIFSTTSSAAILNFKMAAMKNPCGAIFLWLPARKLIFLNKLDEFRVLNPKNFGSNFFDHIFSRHFGFQNGRQRKPIFGHILCLSAPKLTISDQLWWILGAESKKCWFQCFWPRLQPPFWISKWPP